MMQLNTSPQDIGTNKGDAKLHQLEKEFKTEEWRVWTEIASDSREEGNATCKEGGDWHVFLLDL